MDNTNFMLVSNGYLLWEHGGEVFSIYFTQDSGPSPTTMTFLLVSGCQEKKSF